MHKYTHLVIFTLLVVGLSGCALPMKPTPTSVVGNTPTNTSTEISPTATFIAIPTSKATNIPPTQVPISSPIPTKSLPTETPLAIIPPQKVTYAVFLVESDKTLPVYDKAGTNNSVIEQLAADATGMEATGNKEDIGDTTWVELKTPTGKTGWVNRYYLTEMVSPPVFCQDERLDPFIELLKQALDEKDGFGLSAIISPIHGLNLQDIRGGTVANYDTAKAEWVFKSTYALNWGLHPGSGLPVRGTFMQEPYPSLIKVFDSQDTQKNCENISAGGTTYTATWPKEYTHINFLSYYLPGPAGKELDWRTWLVGIEYVDTNPYLFALYQLTWEP